MIKRHRKRESVDAKTASKASRVGLKLWCLLPGDRINMFDVPFNSTILGRVYGWFLFWTTPCVDVWLLRDGRAIWWE